MNRNMKYRYGHKYRRLVHGHSDSGFTLVEMLVVIIMTSILAGIFANTLISAIQIYTDHNFRKSALIDARRAFAMVTHDVREVRSWDDQEDDKLEFDKWNRFERQIWWFTRIKYDELRVRFEYDHGDFFYRQDDDGNYSNEYELLEGGVVGGDSEFTFVTKGGTERITITLVQTIRGRPLNMRVTIFPRDQVG